MMYIWPVRGLILTELPVQPQLAYLFIYFFVSIFIYLFIYFIIALFLIYYCLYT